MFNFLKKRKVSIPDETTTIAAPSPNCISLPDRITQHKDYLRIDQSYCSLMVVDMLPELIHMGWFNNIQNLGGVTISVSNVPNSYKAASDKVSKLMATVGAEYLVAEKNGNNRGLQALGIKYGYYRDLLTQINLRRNNIITVTVVILVTSANYEDMCKKRDRVKDVMGHTGCRILYKRQLTGLLAALPFIDVQSLPEYHDVTVANSACLAPLVSADFSHPSGIYFGQNESGSPAFLDVFIGQPRLFGAHMFVTGTTRSGKSYTVKGITARSMTLGIKSVILDPEGEYRALIETLGGVYVKFTPNMETMFNVFDVEPEYDKASGSYFIDLLTKQDDIVTLFSTMIETLSDERLTSQERALAGQAVKLEYQRCGVTENPNSIYQSTGTTVDGGYAAGTEYKIMPTISSYIEQLKDLGANGLAQRLLPYTKGNSQGFFDGQGMGNFYDSPLIVFDLSGLINKYSKMYANQVMLSWTWEKFVKRQIGVKKRVVVDECWMFMEHDDTAYFLESMARRGAKYNTSLLLATQSFREFLNKAGMAVIGQCDTKLFLKMQQTDADALGQMYNIPKTITDRLMTFRPGQGLLKAGNESAILQFRGLDFEEIFLRSDPEAVIIRG